MSYSRRGILTATGACALLSTQPAQAAASRLRAPFAVPPAPGLAPKAKSLPKTEPLRELANESRYSKDDPSRSTVDPELAQAYERSVAPLRTFSQVVCKTANRYVASGGKDLKSAAEAGGVLAAWASADALKVVSGETAQFSRLSALGPAALAMLQVEGTIKPETRAKIADWLADRAGDTVRHYNTITTKSAANNHRYWAGLSVLSAGIVANRRDYFDWGVNSARIGLAQVTADGALPLELVRKQRALSYHAFATAALVMIAEAAARNGDTSLYSDNGNALHRLVEFTLRHFDNPAKVVPLAGATQEPLANGKLYDSGDVAWLEIYESRFPRPQSVEPAVARYAPDEDQQSGGDVTLLFAPKAKPGKSRKT